MELTQKGKVYVLILIASAAFSIFAISFGFFPYFGFSISFIAFALLAYYIKGDKTQLTKKLFVITLILSALLAIRSEESVTLLNLVGIFYFGSAFALNNEKNSQNIFSIILAPVNLILKSLFTPSDYRLDFKDTKIEEKKKESTLNAIAIALITIASLVVILPLLASANPFFEKLVKDIISLLGLDDLKITENLFRWTFRLVVFGVLAFFIPKMATLINQRDKNNPKPAFELNFFLPKFTVTLVLFIFFITQLQLYLASSQTLANLGYTLSRYTNEVFGQLSAVAAVVLVLLYFDKENKKSNRNLALILAFQGIFLALMAYKSDLDYISSWGFTYKRLYGLAVATWILGIFVIYLRTILRNIDKGIFLVSSVIYTGVILILINFSNFDYLIYHFRPAETGSGMDHRYLTRLSGDSLSYKGELYLLTVDDNEIPTDFEKQRASANGLWILLHKIEGLQKKYQDLDIRGFNLLEYLQYREVKDIDTKILSDKYENTRSY